VRRIRKRARDDMALTGLPMFLAASAIAGRLAALLMLGAYISVSALLDTFFI
jgi:hypothetical protein